MDGIIDSMDMGLGKQRVEVRYQAKSRTRRIGKAGQGVVGFFFVSKAMLKAA